ncbi:hypothetical protein NDU88_005622 [Pleurodeles waltl]|uniref:Uncharacterized protein n=1 Tax=Pleurodeles waltl TaxID=8319 RepID=A0AAV7RPI9_PLEWA|nr:hypothetical protein NDU88_005622 [Pleurodeles waltl]
MNRRWADVVAQEANQIGLLGLEISGQESPKRLWRGAAGQLQGGALRPALAQHTAHLPPAYRILSHAYNCGGRLQRPTSDLRDPPKDSSTVSSGARGGWRQDPYGSGAGLVGQRFFPLAEERGRTVADGHGAWWPCWEGKPHLETQSPPRLCGKQSRALVAVWWGSRTAPRCQVIGVWPEGRDALDRVSGPGSKLLGSRCAVAEALTSVVSLIGPVGPAIPQQAAPITEEEVWLAVKEMPCQRTRRVDRLPLEFYLMFVTRLTPKLVTMYKTALELRELPATSNQALVTSLLKPD